MSPLNVVLSLAGLASTLLAFGLWARRRALHAQGDERTPMWFGFLRRIRTLTHLALVGWVVACAVMLPRIWGLDLMHLVVRGGWGTIVLWTMLVLPPFAINAGLALVTHDVGRKLGTTELSWREVATQIGWSSLAVLALTLCFMLAIAAIDHYRWSEMLLWVMAGLAACIVCLKRFHRAIGLTPHAVSHGELRDRLFAIASRAGVRPRQLFVLPMRRMRMANAFAVQGQVVMVTDLLLKHLTRDEIEAILSHEIAHLKFRHPDKLLWVRAAAAAVPAILLMHGSLAAGAFASLLTVWASSAFSRRIERAADREALRLGAKGEAFIAGLVKLAHLSHVPVRWSRSAGRFLTHPSMAERAAAIGRETGLAPERIDALLAGASVPGDRFEIPAVLDGEGKLFSTPFKVAAITRNTLLLMLLALLVPAAVAFIVHAAGAGLTWRWWAWLASVVLAPVACNAALDALAVGPLRGIRSRLQRRLEQADAGFAASDPVCVALAPHAEPRVYEGFYNWDLGFLSLRHGRLEYRGEETSFALFPDQVTDLRLVPGPPSWIRTACVLVCWQDTAGVGGALRLTPIESDALSGAARHARRLHQRLVTWRADGPTTDTLANAAVPSGKLPPSADVTSLAPHEMMRAATVPTLIILNLLGSAVLCALIGLPFLTWRGIGFTEVALTGCLTQVFLTLPARLRRTQVAPATMQAEPSHRAAA